MNNLQWKLFFCWISNDRIGDCWYRVWNWLYIDEMYGNDDKNVEENV